MERTLLISALVIALAGCGGATSTPSEPIPTRSAVALATRAEDVTPDPTASDAPSFTGSDFRLPAFRRHTQRPISRRRCPRASPGVCSRLSHTVAR